MGLSLTKQMDFHGLVGLVHSSILVHYTMCWECCSICRTGNTGGQVLVRRQYPLLLAKLLHSLTTSSVLLYPKRLASQLCSYQQSLVCISRTAATLLHHALRWGWLTPAAPGGLQLHGRSLPKHPRWLVTLDCFKCYRLMYCRGWASKRAERQMV